MATKAKLLMPTLCRGWAVALAVLFLFISFSLPVFAETISTPAESLSLRDWLAPSGTFEWGGNGGWHYGVKSAYGYDYYSSNSWSVNLISPEKVEADVAFTNPSHIYYRVLVKPDGSEQILDQYYFRGDKSTSNNPIAKFCETCMTQYVTHYYNKRTLPEKNIDISGDGNYKIELRHIEIPGMTGRLYNSLSLDSVIDIYDGSPQAIFSKSSPNPGWDQTIFCKNKICTSDDQNKVNSYPCANSLTWMEEDIGGGKDLGVVRSYTKTVKCYNAGLQARAVKLSTLAKTEKIYNFTIVKLATIKSVSILPSIPLVGEILECDVDADGYTEVVWFVNGKDVARGGNLNPDLFKSGDKILCSATPVAGSRRGTVFDSKEVVALSMPVVNSVSISPNNPEEGDKLKCEASATGPTEINWYVNENWISDGENLEAENTKSGDKVVCSATPFVGSRFGSEVVSNEIIIENGSAAAISPFALAAGSRGNGESKTDDNKNNTAPLLAVVGAGIVALAGAGALILRRGAAVQPTNSQRIKYPKLSGEIKLNLVKSEMTTYTTNFLENVQARLAETKIYAMKIFEDMKNEEKRRQQKLDEQRDRAEREAMFPSGGIPLVKIGNDFFRKDTGEFWSSVLPTLPRTPVELPPPQDRPGRSGPNLFSDTISSHVKFLSGAQDHDNNIPSQQPIPTPHPTPSTELQTQTQEHNSNYNSNFYEATKESFGIPGAIDDNVAETKGLPKPFAILDAVAGLLSIPDTISVQRETQREVTEKTGNESLGIISGEAAGLTYFAANAFPKVAYDTAVAAGKGIIGLSIISADLNGKIKSFGYSVAGDEQSARQATIDADNLKARIYYAYTQTEDSGYYNSIESSSVTKNFFVNSAQGLTNFWDSFDSREKTFITATVGGAVAGAASGAIVGAPALGIGAIPGAIIGGIGGAAVGALFGAILTGAPISREETLDSIVCNS